MSMNWFYSIVRMAGTTTPLTSWLVQLQSELDSADLKSRVSALEDPTSRLHEDVPALSRLLYERLKAGEGNSVQLEESELARYSRALGVLEGAMLITGSHAIGKRFAAGLRVTDPFYMLYMASRFEDQKIMERLRQIVESCGRGQSLRSQTVARETELPSQVVEAMFEIFETRGLGLCSDEVSADRLYFGKA